MANLLNLQTGAFTDLTANQIAIALLNAGFGTTGNIYFLNPASGNDNGPGTSPATAFATLAAGYAAMASGNNDVLVLIGNGASTGSARLRAGFTWAKDAAHLIGICAPSSVSQRARIAPYITDPNTGIAQVAFANFFTVSGNGCLFQNISWFHGFAVGVAAAICLTVSGGRNAFVNCDVEGMGDTASAISATSRSLVITGATGENVFKHCNIGLDTVVRTNANSTVELQANSARNSFEDCTFPLWSSDGLQYALFVGASGMDRYVIFKRCLFIATTVPAGATATAQLFNVNASPGGIIILDPGTARVNATVLGDATTLAKTWNCAPTAVNTGGKGVVGT